MQIDLNKIHELPSIDILAKQLVEGFITGLHKSPYHGFSVEFAEHQLYNQGESTRHIDWKVFARTDRLYTKRFEEETNLRAYIILDQSSSMYYPAANKGKVRFSAIAAATLAFLLQRQRDAVGLLTFDETLLQMTAVKSTELHLQQIMKLLHDVLQSEPKQKKTAIADVLHQVAEKIHHRSLVVIFTDMFTQEEELESVFTALQHLKHKKNEVLLFHVADFETEKALQFENRPHQFIDLESNEVIKFNPFEYRESFEEMTEQFYEAIKLRCGQMKIDFIEVNIHDGVEKVLSNYLIKRARMK